MFDCLLTHSRKLLKEGRYLPCGLQEDFHDADAPLVPADSSWRRLATELPLAGIRRDRTAQFLRRRGAGKLQNLVARAPLDGEAEETASAELHRIYVEGAQVSASLASKLAQHNGLRQFGVDFVNRAPPLELRMLLPEVEASIDQLLEELLGLQALVLPESSRLQELRSAGTLRLRSTHEEALAAFEGQRQHLRELAVASPLYSPMISPLLSKRLAVALWSPSNSTADTMSLGSGSCGPPQMPRFELPDPDEESDGEQEESSTPTGGRVSRPFCSVLALDPDSVAKESPSQLQDLSW